MQNSTIISRWLLMPTEGNQERLQQFVIEQVNLLNGLLYWRDFNLRDADRKNIHVLINELTELGMQASGEE